MSFYPEFNFFYLCVEFFPPSDNTVLLLSLYEAQFLHDYGARTSLNRRIQQAGFHTVGGKTMIVLPWCQFDHFFCLVGVIEAAFDTIFVLESIGGYDPPEGVAVLMDFMEVIFKPNAY